jgi:hypothetical protein
LLKQREHWKIVSAIPWAGFKVFDSPYASWLQAPRTFVCGSEGVAACLAIERQGKIYVSRDAAGVRGRSKESIAAAP